MPFGKIFILSSLTYQSSFEKKVIAIKIKNRSNSPSYSILCALVAGNTAMVHCFYFQNDTVYC